MDNGKSLNHIPDLLDSEKLEVMLKKEIYKTENSITSNQERLDKVQKKLHDLNNLSANNEINQILANKIESLESEKIRLNIYLTDLMIFKDNEQKTSGLFDSQEIAHIELLDSAIVEGSLEGDKLILEPWIDEVNSNDIKFLNHW